MIYFYSGTGNSAYVARKLAEKLQTETVDLGERIKNGVMEAIEANNKASFTVVDASDVVEEEYTTAYGSVIAFGSVELLEGEARLRAFRQMTDALAPHVSREVNEKTVNHCDGAEVFRLVVDHLSGKVGRLTPRP